MLRSIDTWRGLIQLDPRTKFLLLIIAMVAYFNWLPSFIVMTFIALGILLILFSGYISVAVNYILFVTFIYGLSFITIYLPHWIVIIFGIFMASMQFFMPILVYVMLLVYTSTVEDIAIVLDKLKVPSALSIPIMVMFRFIPTIRDEYRHIRNAMVFRGIRPGIVNLLIHPIKTIEYIYVPLLFSLVRIGEELTMSPLTRGLGLYKKRITMHDQTLGWLDYGCITLYMGILIIGFILKNKAAHSI